MGGNPFLGTSAVFEGSISSPITGVGGAPLGPGIVVSVGTGLTGSPSWPLSTSTFIDGGKKKTIFVNDIVRRCTCVGCRTYNVRFYEEKSTYFRFHRARDLPFRGLAILREAEYAHHRLVKVHVDFRWVSLAVHLWKCASGWGGVDSRAVLLCLCSWVSLVLE